MCHLAATLAPLYKLLRHEEPWNWTSEQEKHLQSKELLLSSQVLVHFDPKLPIRLACDASDYGIGAVLSQIMPDGSEKPVAFFSRTLSPTERKYSQIEKEALACVVVWWGSHAFTHTCGDIILSCKLTTSLLLLSFMKTKPFHDRLQIGSSVGHGSWQAMSIPSSGELQASIQMQMD